MKKYLIAGILAATCMAYFRTILVFGLRPKKRRR